MRTWERARGLQLTYAGLKFKCLKGQELIVRQIQARQQTKLGS